MTMTTIKVSTSTRDSLRRIAAERGETLDQALAGLAREHDLVDAAERLEQWEAALPAEQQAVTAALADADRAGWAGDL